MTDMLVKLYALPDLAPHLASLNQKGIEVRRANSSEKHFLADWVRQHFQEGWAAECEVALENRPASCIIAVVKSPAYIPNDDPYHLPDEILVGFACYDAGAKGMFGPLGVDADYRKQGIGTALLLASLYAMKEAGYAYAVIGWVASEEYYARAAGATVIPDSAPGIYRGRLVDNLSGPE